AFSKAAHDQVAVLSTGACSLGVPGKRDINLRAEEPEGRRHHAHHRATYTVEGHRVPEDLLVGTEPLAPEGVGQKDGGFGSGPILLGEDVPPELGRHAEDREKPRRNPRAADALEIAAPRE